MIGISELIKEAQERRPLSFSPCVDIVRSWPLTMLLGPCHSQSVCPVLGFLASRTVRNERLWFCCCPAYSCLLVCLFVVVNIVSQFFSIVVWTIPMLTNYALFI